MPQSQGSPVVRNRTAVLAGQAVQEGAKLAAVEGIRARQEEHRAAVGHRGVSASRAAERAEITRVTLSITHKNGMVAAAAAGW